MDKRKLKELRIRHIVFMEEYGLNFKEFLFIKEDAESYTFYHVPKSKKVILRR